MMEPLTTPVRLPVTRGDQLVALLKHFSAARTFTITALLEEEGGRLNVVQQDGVTDAAAITTAVALNLPKGALLAATIEGTETGTQPGSVYGRLVLRRGALSTSPQTYLLAEGYISPRSSVNWPFPTGRSPLFERPNLFNQSVANPAAGADWTLTPSSTANVRLMTVTFKLTTDATVSTRDVFLELVDASANVLSRISLNQAQGASLARDYNFATGLGHVGDVQGGSFWGALWDVWMQPNFVVRTSTTNIQAGDQFSLINVSMERIQLTN